MKKIFFIIFVAAIFLLIISMMPATIPANQYSIPQVSREAFRQITNKLSEFAQENSKGGITYAENGASDTFAVYCHDVPLVILNNGPGATTMLVFVDYSQRAQGIRIPVDRAVEAMAELGEVSLKPSEKKVTRFDSFILKYRDGVDLNVRCESK